MAMPDEQPLSNEAVRGYLLGLQQSICDAVGAEDGTPRCVSRNVISRRPTRPLPSRNGWIQLSR